MSILVIAAHPDDEVLGCGATIARHAAAGEDVHIIFVSDGETSRGEIDPSAISAREAMARKAAQVLGARPPVFLGFPDNQLDTVPLLDIAKAIEGATRDLTPRRIYTHHSGDLNVDHVQVARACLTAFRPQAGAHTVEDILSFEVLSSTHWNEPSASFIPNVFISVEGFEEAKIAALEVYASEMREWPHARSLQSARHLMAMRGAVIGQPAAEAFTLLRRIES